MKLKILGAKNLPEPTENKFVNLDFDKEKKKKKWKKLGKTSITANIYGVDCTEGQKTIVSSDTRGSLWKCKYSDACYEFKCIFSDLSILVIQITKGKKSKIMGVFCAPINCLKEGYRVFPIVDADMIPVPNSKILVHISFDKRK